MCTRGAILGGKIRSCIRSAPSSKLFIVTSPLGLEEDTMRDWVDREKGEYQTNNWYSKF